MSTAPAIKITQLARSTIIGSSALALVAGFLVLFVNGGARFAVGLTLKPMVEDFGWGRSELGLAVALFQIVSAIAMFFAGYIADRAGPRLALVAGLVISGVGIASMSVVSAPWHALLFYGVIFALGNGTASVTPIGVMVTRAFPGRTALANAVVMSGMSFGQLVMIAGLAAVLVTLSWQSVYVLLGLAHLVLLPLLFFAFPNRMQAGMGERSAEGMSIAQAARRPQFWMLLIVYAICGFDDFFVSTHLVAFAQDQGISTFLAGNLLAFMGLTALIGVIAGGAMSDRFGPVWPTVLSFAARVAVFGLLMLDRSPVSVAIFGFVFGLTFLVTAPLTIIFVSELFGMRHLGSLTGLITMVHHIFGGVGAYLGSAIFDQTGSYYAVFPLMAALSLVAMVLSVMLRQPRAQAA